MENEQTEKRVPKARQIDRKLALFIVGAVILGIILGILISRMLPQNSVPAQPNNVYKGDPLKAADPKTLVDPTQILQLPVFTEWMGSVEGTLVSKTADSFTIERGGKQLTIYLQENLSGFYGQPSADGEEPPRLTLNQIPTGTYLRGAVTITRLSFDDIENRHIFANLFTVEENANQN